MPARSPQYAARKVKRAKWERAASSADETLLAEAIKSDLTSETDILSFWKCDGTEQSVAQIILTIASAHVHLETTDVILVSLADLAEAAESIISTAGRTPFTSMADQHIDVTANPTQTSHIANLFLQAIAAGRCNRMTRRQIINSIGQAALDGTINPDDLTPGVIRHLPELMA